MKLVSPDRTFIYYMYDRADGKSEGVRISRSGGATGFISRVPTARASHPVPFETYDQPGAMLPLTEDRMPVIIANCLALLEAEAEQLLYGQISFEEALNK
jgi:hypothetical protein